MVHETLVNYIRKPVFLAGLIALEIVFSTVRKLLNSFNKFIFSPMTLVKNNFHFPKNRKKSLDAGTQSEVHFNSTFSFFFLSVQNVSLMLLKYEYLYTFFVGKIFHHIKFFLKETSKYALFKWSSLFKK